MPKYKVSVTKDQKKYTIIMDADSDISARKKIHREGYSILGIQEVNEEKIKGHKFYFEAIDKNKNKKTGQVVALDPFKVYVKLKEGLEYDVKFLYSEEDKNKSEGEKLDIIAHLEDQYSLYLAHKNKNNPDKETKKEKKESSKSIETFYMKKELEETYRLIDFVLIKIKNILDNALDDEIDLEKREKLKNLYNSIVKIKKTTNINKLKEIGELALKKVGEIELKILEKNKDGNSKKLLKETNSLLKKLGSDKQFIEKDKDINYILSELFSGIKEKFENFYKKNKEKKKKEEYNIDKESAGYWKTVLLIKKYTDKQKENNIEILKTLFKIYKKEEREKFLDLRLKSKVIKQNLVLLKLKLTGKSFSYTKIVKGYNYFVELLLLLLKILNTYVLWFIYIFSLIIGIFFLLIKFNVLDITLNINGIFVFLYILLASFFIFISRGVITVTINIALFIFIVILGVVNF